MDRQILRLEESMLIVITKQTASRQKTCICSPVKIFKVVRVNGIHCIKFALIILASEAHVIHRGTGGVGASSLKALSIQEQNKGLLPSTWIGH
eukprot:scaffold45816_cov18-Prasinocladus_malaysianus.AAC.2